MTKKSTVAGWFMILLFACGVQTVSCHIAAAQVIIGKRCDGCGRSVPISSTVGGRCPHCGAVWGYERDEFDSMSSGYSPPYHNPIDRMTPRQLRAQARAMKHREMLDETRAMRDRNRGRVQERTEEFRSTNDPVMRAQSWLDTALRHETEGNLRVAAVYYRLIVNNLPETPAASMAASALRTLPQ